MFIGIRKLLSFFFIDDEGMIFKLIKYLPLSPFPALFLSRRVPSGRVARQSWCQVQGSRAGSTAQSE